MSREQLTATTSETCRLLKLPAELRDQIWEHMVIATGSIKLRPKGDYRKNEPIEAGAQPSITRVCVQIRLESIPIFYAQNTFRIDGDNLNLTSRGTFEGNIYNTLRCLHGHTEEVEHLELQICGHRNNFFKLELQKASRTFSLTPSLVEGSGAAEGWCSVSNPHTLARAGRYLEDAVQTNANNIGLHPSEMIELLSQLVQ